MPTRNAYMPTFDALHRELNRLFENATEAGEEPRATWSPRADVLEYGDRFEVRLDLPGVKREDVNVAFEKDTLEITGERKLAEKEEGTAYYRCECASGPFARRFRFPSLVSASGIDARMENGVLTLSVPKAEEAKPRTIAIK